MMNGKAKIVWAVVVAAVLVTGGILVTMSLFGYVPMVFKSFVCRFIDGFICAQTYIIKASHHQQMPRGRFFPLRRFPQGWALCD